MVTGTTGGPSGSDYSAPYPNARNEPSNYQPTDQPYGYDKPVERPSSKTNRNSYEPAPTNYYDTSANEPTSTSESSE